MFGYSYVVMDHVTCMTLTLKLKISTCQLLKAHYCKKARQPITDPVNTRLSRNLYLFFLTNPCCPIMGITVYLRTN